MPETRPTTNGLPAEQRELALAHWHLWLYDVTANRHRERRPATECAAWHEALLCLERRMQPETLHRLALARDRYWCEQRQEDGNGEDIADRDGSDVRQSGAAGAGDA